ncbi:MAG: aminotransferase class V-fold PLP-dependent enzyme [Defluviitaleaceae bacterium]|nr:aminotransferase class V-fold PLP-dependent enzyme [Defluviitaleaceae bacterium]
MLYLDNAATTPLRPEALAAMMPFLTENFYNPSGFYSPAQNVRSKIDTTRQIVAEILNVRPDEIIFTSGGTESDNWAIKGVIEAAKKGSHIITTSAEHHGILYVCKYLETRGYPVTYLPVDGEGFVCPADLEASIRPDTCLISIMFANNEVGTLQPINELAAIAAARGIPFHTDAVQAIGHVPVDAGISCISLLSLSAHKFGGPKGAGCLYVKKGTPITPVFQGGAQERNRRAGTENVAGIIGLGTALQLAAEEMPLENARISALRDKLICKISENIPHTRLNGPADGSKRLPGNVNFSFRFIEGEALLGHLDFRGCCASTGSACSSGSLEPSHVLMAMGLSHEQANGAVRFSLGKENTEDDIQKLLNILQPIVEKLRSSSPLYDDYLRSI